MAVIESGDWPGAKDWSKGLSRHEFMELHTTHHIATDKRLDSGPLCVERKVDAFVMRREDDGGFRLQQRLTHQLNGELCLKVPACVGCESVNMKTEEFKEPQSMNRIFSLMASCRRGHNGCNKRLIVTAEPLLPAYVTTDPVAKEETNPDVPVTAGDAW